ncbi:MAG: protease inhibitor I42 family protein [Desulfovibrionaceae bacterium]
MSDLRRAVFFLIPACLLALVSACSMLGLGGHGQRVELNLDRQAVAKTSVSAGDVLVLNVRNPGSGGYQFAGAYFDPDILLLEKHQLLPPERAMPGDFGRATYELRALKPGRTLVVIKIKRPWEDKPPEQYKSVQVTVHE